MIEYRHEAKPSILGLQIVFLAARRDDDEYDEMMMSVESEQRARGYASHAGLSKLTSIFSAQRQHG